MSDDATAISNAASSTSEERLQRIEAVTDAALSRLGLEDLLAELLQRTRDLLSADTAAVLMLDPTGTQLVATAASGLEEEVRQGVRVPVGAGFAGRIAASREPVALEHVDATNVVNPILLAKHVVSVVGVPMISEGRVIGVIHVGSTTERHFTDDEVRLLQLVADRASVAAQARTARLDRAATVALQRSLLPARLPTISGLDVSARYVPGAEVGVGGDWYDIFELPSGHVGVAIGDVAGNGLRAAVVMGRIRSALRAYAMETNDPADVLTRLDRKIQLFEPEAMATAIYAVMDPSHACVTLSCAGHLPPAFVSRADVASLIELPVDLPLGAYPDSPRHANQIDFEPGSGLFLYTDGLVERRSRLISASIDLLLTALPCGAAETMCASAMAMLVDDESLTDDIAVLAVRNRAPRSE